MRLIFFIILLTALPISAQEVQELQVFDMSGGLVNLLANGVQNQNQSIALENYDLLPWGGLKRRSGFRSMSQVNSSVQRTSSLFTHYGLSGPELFLSKADTTWNANDSINERIETLVRCNDVTCTTHVAWGFFQRGVGNSLPYNASQSTWAGETVFSISNSEPVRYDGEAVRPLRPLVPFQPQVFPVDSSGNLNGVYAWKYCFVQDGAASELDTSMLSGASPDVEIHDGYAALMLEGPFDRPHQDTALVWRRKNDTGLYYLVGKLRVAGADTVWFIDNQSDASLTRRSGALYLPQNPLWYNNDPSELSPYVHGQFDYIAGPGQMRVDVQSNAGAGLLHNLVADPAHDPNYFRVYYSIAFVDSSGRYAQLTPAGGDIWNIPINTGNTAYWTKAEITEIPANKKTVNSTHYRYKYKYRILLRAILHVSGADLVAGADALTRRWFIVDTLPDSARSWRDVRMIPPDSADERLFSTDFLVLENGDGTVDDGLGTEYAGWFQPEEIAVDPNCLPFRPTDVAFQGSRYFAIGNPYNRNSFVYSDFGSSTVWPRDKVIAFPSQAGDWPVRLAPTADAMLIFRQNSIYAVTGMSFFNFTLSEIISGVGVSAPYSLGSSRGQLYFAHTTGIYQFGGQGGLSAISTPIQASYDSVSNLSGAWGGVIGTDYWFCSSGKTYIYSQTPSPHWKAYSRTITDMIQFKETNSPDYTSDRFVVLTPSDSCFLWGVADSMDGPNRILAKYRSPFFFDNSEREKICYVDLYGDGDADSVTISVFDQLSSPIKTVTFKPDFTDKNRDRVIIDEICERASIQITDNGRGNYSIRGYTVGWLPWDRRKL